VLARLPPVMHDLRSHPRLYLLDEWDRLESTEQCLRGEDGEGSEATASSFIAVA
jgi:hypothetical protein